MKDMIFESPYPSVASVPEPEWDQDYVPECPSDFDDEQDAVAVEQLLRSLGCWTILRFRLD